MTYRLILDTLVVSGATPMACILAEGNVLAMTKLHKKWSTKIKNNTWVELPANTPVLLNTALLVALRVVEISEEELKLEKLQNDPAKNRFIENARDFGPTLANESLDGGYK